MDLTNVGYGVIGGIAGSLVFGGMMGMLPSLGRWQVLYAPGWVSLCMY